MAHNKLPSIIGVEKLFFFKPVVNLGWSGRVSLASLLTCFIIDQHWGELSNDSVANEKIIGFDKLPIFLPWLFMKFELGKCSLIADCKPCSAQSLLLPTACVSQIAVWVAFISPRYFSCFIMNKLFLFDPIIPFHKYLQGNGQFQSSFICMSQPLLKSVSCGE